MQDQVVVFSVDDNLSQKLYVHKANHALDFTMNFSFVEWGQDTSFSQTNFIIGSVIDKSAVVNTANNLVA